ncbi:MAG: hypothetical protein HYU69_08540 [Bacteroidetes bacterium]|nr:hypothetical protein [Bacteroidota bacterium]
MKIFSRFAAFVFAILLTIFFPKYSSGQHEQHQMKAKEGSSGLEDTMSMMPHSFSLNLPMSRNGSGTGWMPDATVMYGHGAHVKNWMFMVHANLFLRYNKQDIFNNGIRGGEKFDAPNWIMAMGQKKAGKKGLFRFSGMFSFDPFTIGSEGYPLLFQTGEIYKGKRLTDKQHPHDLFSELSVGYTQMFSKDVDVTGYLGYPGEPALGPVAFMHRNSALNNPDAPLSHHWQDATHITFGVATLGIRYKFFKIEGSGFTGREPDNKRYDFDNPKFDSYSVRLLCNPTKQIAIQVSQAFLNKPEIAKPEQDINRTTASIINHIPIGEENKYLATTIVWGLNNSDHKENSFLLEPAFQLDRTAIYGRYEWIQKSAEELDLPQFSNGQTIIFTIQGFTLGVNRVFLRKAGNNLAFGIQASIFIPDSQLTSLYGQNPFSGEVYLRFYPHLMHIHRK